MTAGTPAEFQFKHCTIIRGTASKLTAEVPQFQFKHCTIIREQLDLCQNMETLISIQALYDYKSDLCTTRKILINFNSSIVRL